MQVNMQLEEGDVIQISGPSVPAEFRNTVYWKVRRVSDEGNVIDLEGPFNDEKCYSRVTSQDWVKLSRKINP